MVRMRSELGTEDEALLLLALLLPKCCSIKVSNHQSIQCNTALNDALRMIFGFNRWESVRNLSEAAGYKSLTDLFAKAKKKFEWSLKTHRTKVVSLLLRNIENNVEVPYLKLL